MIEYFSIRMFTKIILKFSRAEKGTTCCLLGFSHSIKPSQVKKLKRDCDAIPEPFTKGVLRVFGRLKFSCEIYYKFGWKINPAEKSANPVIKGNFEFSFIISQKEILQGHFSAFWAIFFSFIIFLL